MGPYRRASVSCLAVLLLAACGRTPSGDGPTAQGSPDGPVPTNDARFHDALRKAAAGYESLGWTEDVLRWAPGLCRIPTVEVVQSRSPDATTHGGKLYWLFAKDHEAYAASAEGGSQPVGQVLVKEAWTTRRATEAEIENAKRPMPEPVAGVSDRFDTPVKLTVERDGVHWTPDGKQALYVMLKLEPATEGTDGGWVYGTLTPDGATVTSAGRVASCMGCHEKASHDRMLGRQRP